MTTPAMRAALRAAHRRRLTKIMGPVTGATQANPVVVSVQYPHGLKAGDSVWIENVVGMTEINDREFVIANPTRRSFELQGENGSLHTAYVFGGRFRRTKAVS